MPGDARFAQLEELFDRALAVPSAERDAFLATACPDDVLRAEVAKLLANDAGAVTALGRSIAREATDLVASIAATQIGARIGPYRITELIGEGGMGVVYRATRDDAEYAQEVAIKLLKHGFSTSYAIARFRDERQILATLEHPGIVRLLDGGTTDDGRPYLAMELVAGREITRYVREERCSLARRLALVGRVCAAVHYAHNRLVVHRDLKPSNILVDETGSPKLLDFGIAKLVDADREVRTRTGAALLTPAYASPEQVRGEPVTVRTDVYSLGAVLFELITERTPHGDITQPLDLLRAVTERDPPRASSVAAPELRAAIAGDLDTIIAKALARDPRQRYASIEELAADLRHHAEGEPIAARPSTFRYRATKFVRRHRLAVALASTFTLALATSSVVALVQARRAAAHAERAEQRFQDLRALVTALVFEFDDGVKGLPGGAPARELMVMRALELLDRLATDPHDPALRDELVRAYRKIGDVQLALGHADAGRATHERAGALATRDARDP